jgi:hypothetical protein
MCYCRCICHTPAHAWLGIVKEAGDGPLPLFGRVLHGVEALNGECSECVRECNHRDVAPLDESPALVELAAERDPATPELAVENASPDPLADWSESERAYAFGDR